MLSGGKPAFVMVSRNGVFRLFQVGTLRPSLSLPSPVSTTIRSAGVSTTSEWIDIFNRPSSLAKCGISQGSLRISSLLASGRMKRVLPTVSSSTIFVILTLPTFQCIGAFPLVFRSLAAKTCWFSPVPAMDQLATSGVIAVAKPRECAMPELTISPEKVGFLIEKAREFDVKEAATDLDSGSNGADDNMIDVLEDDGSDPVAREITGFINALSEDEQVDLVALMRLGRGDGTTEEWKDLRREAGEGRDGRAARYLLGEPMLGDFLAEGLDQFGFSWTGERITADSASVRSRR